MSAQKTPRALRILLDDTATQTRLVSSLDPIDPQRLLALSDLTKRSTVTIARAGIFTDPRYGRVEISTGTLDAMVANFDRRVLGVDVFVDVDHKPGDGAAGKLVALSRENDRLMGVVEWTAYGLDAVRERGFRYLSADYAPDYTDNESGEKYGPVLLGAGLTLRPVIKRMDPVELSHVGGNDDAGALLHATVATTLQQEARQTMDKWLKKLLAALTEKGIAEPIRVQFADAYKAAAAHCADSDEACESIFNQMVKLAEDLPAAGDDNTPAPVQLIVNTPAAETTLSEDAVRQLIAEAGAADRARQAQESQDLERRRTLFSDTLAAAEFEEIPAALRSGVDAVRDCISLSMSDDEVKALAAAQVTQIEAAIASQKLFQLGYEAGPTGSPRITVSDANEVNRLQETIDRRAGITDMPDSRRFSATGGALPEENRRFAEQCLAHFDRENGAQLHQEARQLAAGDSVVSDVAVPVAWERTVIREALYRLIGLQFVNAGTLPFAASYNIPYSYRDTTAAGVGNTRIYEGGSIARAAVKQTFDSAYNVPQKLAFEVSDELRYLTASPNAFTDWDAVGENTRNASRIIGEDLDRLIFNEILHASDEFAATAVSNENLELQADDTDKVFILAQWPVCRPRANYDLQGNQVGSTVNPITVTYDSVARAEYDGTGTQAAGIYYVLDYNLGEIYLVDEAGAIQTPANATAYTISYSYTTNVNKFDTDLGSSAVDDHWDVFLNRFGGRKAAIEDDRYYMPNFSMMSGTTMNSIEQAKKFAANFRVPATELAANGNLGRIKDVPAFKTSAPSLWIGDQRVVLGENATTRLRMAKGWTMSELENQKDANGRFTGKKEAYGDQFVVLHTPTQLKGAYSSIVLYSATARVARVTP